MELAVITDEIDADLDRAAAVMAEYGVRGAELRTIWDRNISEASEEYLQRAKRVLDSHGIHVIGIASPFYKCDLAGEEAEGPVGPLHSASARGLGEQIALLERCIRTAHFFDTNLVRVFSFWKHGPLTPRIEDMIVDAFVEPAEIAEREGAVLALENEGACYIGTGAETARILEKINSPVVRAVWDPGNSFHRGERPFPDGYEAIKPFIAHVHVKDAAVTAGEPETHWTVVGEGQIDWLGQLSALKQSGYNGWVSLETHYNGHETKEASTRACLEGLMRLMAEAS
jgi:sugar phosphate isomerase/epimerase